MRRLLLLALFLWAIIAMAYAACAYAETPPGLAGAVAACEPVGKRLYPLFGAYVEPGTPTIHYFSNPVSQFAFNRCMSEHGFNNGRVIPE